MNPTFIFRIIGTYEIPKLLLGQIYMCFANNSYFDFNTISSFFNQSFKSFSIANYISKVKTIGIQKVG